MLDEDEWAGAENVRLRELHVFGELRGAVDAVPWRGEIRQHRRIRPLQVKHDGLRIGRVDARDRGVIGLAHRGDTLRRMDDALIAHLHIGRSQFRPVVKQHVGAQLEGVSTPVRRDGPGFGKIAHHLRIVGSVEFEKCGVVRRHDVNQNEREIGVAVVVGRLGVDGKRQDAAALRRRRGAGEAGEGKENRAASDSQPAKRRTPAGRAVDRHARRLVLHCNLQRKRLLPAAVLNGTDRSASGCTAERALPFPCRSSLHRRPYAGARR